MWVEAALVRLVFALPVVVLGRAVALPFLVRSLGGGRDMSPGLPSLCQASSGGRGKLMFCQVNVGFAGPFFGRSGFAISVVGVDGSVSVLEASFVLSEGAGGVGGSPVIINEIPSVDDGFDIAVAGVCASDLVMSGAVGTFSVPVCVSSSGGDSGAGLDSF